MHNEGHNNPPDNAVLFAEKIAELESKASDTFEVEITEANAGDMRDLIGLGDDLAKEIEKTRKAEKAPHLDAGKAVDALYNPLKDAAKSAMSLVRSKLQAFLIEQKRIADEKAREAERLAAEEAAKAKALEDDALVGEEAAKDAEAAAAEARLAAAEEKAKASIKGTSGMRAMSMRTTRKAQIVDAAKLVEAFIDHPDVIAAAEKVANSEIRAAKGQPITIPGVEIVEMEALV